MEFIITYNKSEGNKKVSTLRKLRRFQKRFGITYEKVTFLVTFPTNLTKKDEDEILAILKREGNTIHSISNTDSRIEGFTLLNRIFLQAIKERNLPIMKFLKENTSSIERQFLENLNNEAEDKNITNTNQEAKAVGLEGS